MSDEVKEIILLIEDDAGTAELVCEKLREDGRHVAHVKSGGEARAWLAHNHPQLILLDYSLPDMTGAELAKQVKDMPPFIITTGAGDEDIAVTMMKRGARDYLVKDIHFLDNLPLVVKQVLREAATERQLAEMENELRRNHANLRALIENIDGSVWSIDLQYNLIVGNELFHRNTRASLGRRLKTGELILLQNFPPNVNAEWRGYYDRALRGERFRIETITRLRSVPDYVEYSFNPILSAVGNVEGVTIFGRDITERKRAEDDLRESEERFRDITFSMADWVWEVDENGVYTYSSQKSIDFFGLSYEDIIGKTPFDFMPAEEARRVSAVFSELAANKLPIKDMENWNIGRNGERLCMLTNAVPILDKEGSLKGYRGVDKDITERKQAEEALRLSELGLKEAQSVARIGNWKWDVKNGEVTWSDEMYRIFGIDKNSYSGRLGDVISKVIHPDDLHLVLPSNAPTFAEKKPVEYRVILPDGSIRHIWAKSGDAVVDNEGNPMFLTGIAQDITERKQAEDDLRKSEERLRDITFSMADWVWEVDENSVYTYSSQKGIELFGSFREEIIGKTPFDFMSADETKRVSATFSELVANKSPIKDLENWNIRKNGERICMLTNAVPILDKEGSFKGYRGVDKDITERKKIEDALLFLLQSGYSDNDFFMSLARYLYNSLDMDYVCIDRLSGDQLSAQTVAIYFDGKFEDNAAYTLKDTPCGNVVGNTVCVFPSQVRQLFPKDVVLQEMAAESYVGATLWSLHGQPIGLIAVIGRKPMDTAKRSIAEAILKLTAVRAAGELERKQAEDNLLIAKEALEAANSKLQTAFARERQLARTDVLTGVNNRRYLFELAERAFDVAARYQQPLSVIMFDIDNFKNINDVFGHALGDQMLQRVTQAACAELRSVDVIGRYGGEEFAIILPMTNAQYAHSLAERVRVRVAAIRIPTEKGDAAVTLSIGIAEAKHTSGESLDSILIFADQAMYTAKQAGRNRTVINEK